MISVKVIVVTLFTVTLLSSRKMTNAQNAGTGCAVVLCPIGTVCTLEYVTCVQAPCPPITNCVAIQEDPCVKHNCQTNTKCATHALACKKAPCPRRPFCKPTLEVLNTPTCETVDCATGLKCVLKPVQCFRAPCPRQPFCVPV